MTLREIRLSTSPVHLVETDETGISPTRNSELDELRLLRDGSNLVASWEGMSTNSRRGPVISPPHGVTAAQQTER